MKVSRHRQVIVHLHDYFCASALRFSHVNASTGQKRIRASTATEVEDSESFNSKDSLEGRKMVLQVLDLTQRQFPCA